MLCFSHSGMTVDCGLWTVDSPSCNSFPMDCILTYFQPLPFVSSCGVPLVELMLPATGAWFAQRCKFIYWVEEVTSFWISPLCTHEYETPVRRTPKAVSALLP